MDHHDDDQQRDGITLDMIIFWFVIIAIIVSPSIH